MNYENWWQKIEPAASAALTELWVPVGLPGHAGTRKHTRRALLDARFGADGWRTDHYVRGKLIPKAAALAEYEECYRVFLRSQPALVDWLTTWCGNVYDDNPTNVHDHDYRQPHTRLNHFQDISVRRVLAELADDPAWPAVTPTASEEIDLIDLNDGSIHHMPRAYGLRGRYLLQIRAPESPGFFLNPAAVPVYDPTLITAHPQMEDWYLHEGCQHLSVEAFWQMSKVIVVRYDRFLALGPERNAPLAGLE